MTLSRINLDGVRESGLRFARREISSSSLVGVFIAALSRLSAILARVYHSGKRERGERYTRGKRFLARFAKLGGQVDNDNENSEDGFASGGFALLKRLQLN